MLKKQAPGETILKVGGMLLLFSWSDLPGSWRGWSETGW